MSELKFDETFDFVVVGSGGGSMCAALVMRKAGKSVVVLEKTDLIGGTTSRSGGVMWIPNNRFMKEAGIADSYEQAMQYMEATAGQSVDAPGSTLERRQAYVTEGPKMIDFLVEQGIKMRRSPSWPEYVQIVVDRQVDDAQGWPACGAGQGDRQELDNLGRGLAGADDAGFVESGR